MGQQDTLIEYFYPADNYGKGLLLSRFKRERRKKIHPKPSKRRLMRKDVWRFFE